MRISKRTWQSNGTTRHAWRVSYVDASGRRVHRQFAFKRDAEAFAQRVSSELHLGEHAPAADRTTLNEAAEVWLAALRLGRDGEGPVSRATTAQYEWALGHYIKPHLGARRLSELTRPALLEFRDWLLTAERASADADADTPNGPLARGSARKVLKALKACLNEARRRGLVSTDHWRDVTIRESARQKARVEIPSREQVRALLELAATRRDHPDKHVALARRRMYAIVATAAMTGLRQGEIRALAKDCIDFKQGLIRVERAADSWNVIGRPKTANSRRTVEMPPALIAILKEWSLAAPKSATAIDLVFPRHDGGIMDKANLYHRGWAPLRAAAGLWDLHFHALRHFYASNLIAAGASPREIMEAMGHSSVLITFDTYGHLFPDDRDARRARATQLAEGLLRS